MNQVACMMLAVVSLATAWNPVRPGALVKKVGDMIIVNQSVRVLLKFDNMNVVRENVKAPQLKIRKVDRQKIVTQSTHEQPKFVWYVTFMLPFCNINYIVHNLNIDFLQETWKVSISNQTHFCTVAL